jgi:hypothetical protein
MQWWRLWSSLNIGDQADTRFAIATNPAVDLAKLSVW